MSRFQWLKKRAERSLHAKQVWLSLLSRARQLNRVVRHQRAIMDHIISASTTFFWKYIFATLWIGGFGTGALNLLFNPKGVVFNGVRGAATLADQLFFLAVWICGSAFILWFSVPLKRIRLRADGLVVSNYRREIMIPYGAIERVTQNILITGRHATIHLHVETPFGRRITFIPVGLGKLAFWKEDDIVKELRQYAGRANSVSRD